MPIRLLLRALISFVGYGDCFVGSIILMFQGTNKGRVDYSICVYIILYRLKVMKLLKEIDPEAVEQRRKRCLKRRVCCSKVL